MKPSIIVSSSDLERLEGLLTLPAFRSRSDTTACARNSNVPTCASRRTCPPT